MMNFATDIRPFFVCLLALCLIQFTDTHIPLARQRGFQADLNTGSFRQVRDYLGPSQLRSFRSRWNEQGLNPLTLETMLRSNIQDFIRTHGTDASLFSERRNPLLEIPRQGRRGDNRGRLDRQSRFTDRDLLRGRNLEPTIHEGHDHRDHSHSGRNVNRTGQRDRNRRRGDRRQAGDAERSSRRELRRNRRRGPDERNDRRGRRQMGTDDPISRRSRPRRTEIDTLGRPVILGERDGPRNLIRPRNDRHEDGHLHGHLGDRLRGGIERRDGTRLRTGLDRLRSRNNQVIVQPSTGNRRRRRRLGNIIKSFFQVLG